MSPGDAGAFALFLFVWIFLEPLLAYGGRSNGIPHDMQIIRRAWMREVLTRDMKLIGDTAILGHTINSASFFASANLLVLMGVSGALFVDPASIQKTGLLANFFTGTAAWMFQAKVMLVFATLLRGLSDFIWAVRQLNYCLAAIGSSPSRSEGRDVEDWADALASIMNPALQTFSNGVRSYYFVFAASLWFLGPWAFLAGTVMSALILTWRHMSSETARGLRRIRQLLERTQP